MTAREDEENRELWQGHENSRTSSESKIPFRWGFLASLLTGRSDVFLLFCFIFGPLPFPLVLLQSCKDKRTSTNEEKNEMSESMTKKCSNDLIPQGILSTVKI